MSRGSWWTLGGPGSALHGHLKAERKAHHLRGDLQLVSLARLLLLLKGSGPDARQLPPLLRASLQFSLISSYLRDD